MKEKVLVTGATGFIGGEIVLYFVSIGYDVIAIGRSENPFVRVQKVSYFKCDIVEDPLLFEVDIVVHAAGLADDLASWEELYRNNVVATKRLYKTVPHRLFIHISSSSVYDSKTQVHTENEHTIHKLLTPYGRSKLMTDEYLQDNHKHGTSCYVLRPRAVYGVNDKKLMPKLLRLCKGRWAILPGKLNYNVSMTHIDNLVQAVKLCVLSKDASSYTVYNVADDKVYRLRSVVNYILNRYNGAPLKYLELPLNGVKLLAKGISLLGGKSNLNPTSISIFCQDSVLDIAKIKRDMGYRPLKNFENTIDDVIDTYRRSDIP